MSHLCHDHIKHAMASSDRSTDMYTCGECSSQYPTICQLHAHLQGHVTGGSYHFDHVLNMAFSKYDSCCRSTQTDIDYSTGIYHIIKENITSRFNAKANKTIHINRFKRANRNKLPTRLNLRSSIIGDKESNTAENNDDLSEKTDKTSKELAIEHDQVKLIANTEADLNDDIDSDISDDFQEQISEVSSVLIPESGRKKRNSFHIDTSVINNLTKEIQNRNASGNTKRSKLISNTHKYTLNDDRTHSLHIGIETTSARLLEISNNKSTDKVKVAETWFPVNSIASETVDKLPLSNVHNSTDDTSPEYRDDQISTANRNVSKLNDSFPMSHTKHSMTSVKSNKVTCNVCKKIVTKSNIKGHMSYHTGKKNSICDVCGKDFTCLKSLANHKRHVHVDDDVMKTCRYCDARFPTKPRLENHMRCHIKEMVFPCEQCDKVFYVRSNLTRHIRNMHTQSVSFKCSICDKDFHDKNYLRIHEKSHAVIYSCDSCEMKFNRLSSLKRHAKIHSGYKPHVCHICQRKFIQKSPFWIHMEKHHELTKQQMIEMFPEKHGDKNVVASNRPDIHIQDEAASSMANQDLDES